MFRIHTSVFWYSDVVGFLLVDSDIQILTILDLNF